MHTLLALASTFIVFSSLFGQENSALTAKVELLKRDPKPGGESTVLLVVKNSSKRRIFIDHEALTTMHTIEFLDRTGAVGSTHVQGPGFSSHGGTLPIVRIHETTLGLDPGHSFIRILKIRNPQRVDWASIHISAQIPVAYDLNTKGEDWPTLTVSSTLHIKSGLPNPK